MTCPIKNLKLRRTTCDHFLPSVPKRMKVGAEAAAENGRTNLFLRLSWSVFCSSVDHVQAHGPGLSREFQPIRTSPATPESSRGNRRGAERAPGALLFLVAPNTIVIACEGGGDNEECSNKTRTCGPTGGGGEGAEGETGREGLPLQTGEDVGMRRSAMNLLFRSLKKQSSLII